MRQKLRNLAADCRGVTIIEFSLLLPVMLSLICGTIEFGYIGLARNNLEAAVNDAARQTTVGLGMTSADRSNKMKNFIRERMKFFPGASGDTLKIDSKAYSDPGRAAPEDFEDVNKNGVYDKSTDTTPGEPFQDRNGNGVWDASAPISDSLGGEGDIVRYEASYPTRLFFGRILGMPNAVINLKSTAIARNERKGETL